MVKSYWRRNKHGGKSFVPQHDRKTNRRDVEAYSFMKHKADALRAQNGAVSESLEVKVEKAKAVMFDLDFGFDDKVDEAAFWDKMNYTAKQAGTVPDPFPKENDELHEIQGLLAGNVALRSLEVMSNSGAGWDEWADAMRLFMIPAYREGVSTTGYGYIAHDLPLVASVFIIMDQWRPKGEPEANIVASLMLEGLENVGCSRRQRKVLRQRIVNRLPLFNPNGGFKERGLADAVAKLEDHAQSSLLLDEPDKHLNGHNLGALLLLEDGADLLASVRPHKNLKQRYWSSGQAMSIPAVIARRIGIE